MLTLLTLIPLATILGFGAALLTEFAWQHRATLAREYRALAALRGGKHARTLSRPHLTLIGGGKHAAPRRRGRHETREPVAA